MKWGTIAEYKGFGIDFDVFGEGEYSIQFEGDDLIFKSEQEAKEFIDSIA